ncbi:DDE_3 domain-containing protein [Trichonephila clavipes]|nr:DDE_3 domain-containing protein [Trichonephila clavipes]
MLDGLAPLHVFERGSVTGVRYGDEVLESYVSLFRGACGPEFILMDNNVRPHRALMIDEFLESEDIRCMDFPARSLNINPREHVWDALRSAIVTLLQQPSGNESSIAERLIPIATRIQTALFQVLQYATRPV